LKISVKAKTGAREAGIKKVGEEYVVAVKERPVEGAANIAIMAVLAKHFKVSLAAVRLISGFSSRQKLFEIDL
jgi:uncharacterized protein YggU (UPF0235/DUF167 family)